MGRLLKDLTNIGSQIQEGDKILVERENKGYSANLSEILATKADSGHTHDEYMTELPDNVVTYTIQDGIKNIETNNLVAGTVTDDTFSGTLLSQELGVFTTESVITPSITLIPGGALNFDYKLSLDEDKKRLVLYYEDNQHGGDHSSVVLIPTMADIESTDGLASETYVDEKVAALVNGAPDTLDTLDELAAALKDNKDIVTVLENAIATKQDKIDDLAAIRSGAELGATALQTVPSEYVTETELGKMGYSTTMYVDQEIAQQALAISVKADKSSLATVATSGSYNDLKDKPTIPSAVTESTVSGWGFTKNTGTYSKPSNGIPKTDLASDVQTSLGKADTALQASDLTFATDEDIDNLFI